MEQIPSDHTQDTENVEPIVGNHSDISEHSDIDNNDIGGSGCDTEPFSNGSSPYLSSVDLCETLSDYVESDDSWKPADWEFNTVNLDAMFDGVRRIINGQPAMSEESEMSESDNLTSDNNYEADDDSTDDVNEINSPPTKKFKKL